MNRGAVALVRVEVSQEEKARIGVCSRTHIQRLQAGTERPSAAKREAFRVAFGIPVDAWDQPVEEAVPVADPAAVPPAQPMTLEQLEAGVLAEASRMLTELRTRDDLPAAARASLIRACGQVVDAHKRRVMKLQKSSEWIRLRERLSQVVLGFRIEERDAFLRALEEAAAEGL